MLGHGAVTGGDQVRDRMGRCLHTFLYLRSEAAPYMPAEEKSPLFSIQREGIDDDEVLYRLNRSVMGCPGWGTSGERAVILVTSKNPQGRAFGGSEG